MKSVDVIMSDFKLTWYGYKLAALPILRMYCDIINCAFTVLKSVMYV